MCLLAKQRGVVDGGSVCNSSVFCNEEGPFVINFQGLYKEYDIMNMQLYIVSKERQGASRN